MSETCATLSQSGASYQLSSRKTTKETDMDTLVLSTLLFQAVASVTLVLGAAAGAVLPARRTPG
jgi:hypothetical protein